ncbi:MAG: pyridoxine 5'-phosphate synthase, partial [Elusimicrobiaceae bacterium]|nr:pyridoxine 5'-phosphate synthase [Elusimicrobiaceae bacterium]
VNKLKMELHSGHGLDYENVQEIATLPKMKCLNIGFSIISRSLFSGFGNAIEEMKNLIK